MLTHSAVPLSLLAVSPFLSNLEGVASDKNIAFTLQEDEEDAAVEERFLLRVLLRCQ
jgi:hypothetical protein